jgi:PASTA domain
LFARSTLPEEILLDRLKFGLSRRSMAVMKPSMRFLCALSALTLILAACGSNTSSSPSTVTVTKPASTVPSAAGAPSVGSSEPSTASASGSITIPDVTGQNGKIAEQKLEDLGLTNVELSSANPKYSMVLLPANWTVVSIDPPPGTSVSAGDAVVVKVTKP